MNINFHKTLNKLTNQLKSYSMSNFDLLDIDPDVTITLSSKIKHIKFADELVNTQGIGILLWQITEKSGHWLGLIRDRRKKTFEIFDSYAYPFLKINKKLNAQPLQDGTMINALSVVNLIKGGGYKVVFNKRQLQTFERNDNTCGRWVALRLSLYCNNITEFHRILHSIEKNEGIKPIQLALLATVDYK